MMGRGLPSSAEARSHITASIAAAARALTPALPWCCALQSIIAQMSCVEECVADLQAAKAPEELLYTASR
jgi:hypothetical protein